MILVILLSFLTEYAGVLGVMIGSSRRYDGPMGKSDRALAFSLISLGIATYLLPLEWLNVLLWFITFLLLITVINRVKKGLQEAKNNKE